jgi:hypothetical protein
MKGSDEDSQHVCACAERRMSPPCFEQPEERLATEWKTNSNRRPWNWSHGIKSDRFMEEGGTAAVLQALSYLHYSILAGMLKNISK